MICRYNLVRVVFNTKQCSKLKKLLSETSLLISLTFWKSKKFSSPLFSFHIMPGIPKRYTHEKTYHYNGLVGVFRNINFLFDVPKC